jgi:serine/threonine-protein kinase
MTPPDSIAHYKLTSKLGEGGMGAVYRATDTKLGREVAIKLLPPAFAEDALRMQRFEREAQVLASLNHPNVAAIYGIERAAIVMELVEGEDLRGPLPIDTAIAYARQIAAGLEAAHEKGVVHRDLKPANIKVTSDGVVKLLDFGLAKTTEASAAVAGAGALPTNSPTLSLTMTQAGMILGTAAYMAPEQARGKPVDKRADIWAFGAVLFEMLAGSSPFSGGETVSDALASVIAREPEWATLPKETPPHIRRLLERCLRKDSKLRLRDIGEARIALDEPIVPAAPKPAAPARSRLPWIVAACATLVALLAIGLAFRRSPAAEQPLMRIHMDLGPDAVAGARLTAAVSPDGSRLAYLTRTADGRQQLTTRQFDQPAGVTLAGTDGAEDLFFSPDGQWIGYRLGYRLMKIPAQGGAPTPICASSSTVRGVAWSDDGTIVFGTTTGGLQRVSTGGELKPVTDPGKLNHRSDRWPQFLPGGETILYTGQFGTASLDDSEILTLNLKTGQSKPIYRGGYNPHYVPAGYLLYVRQGSIYAVRFNSSRLETSGTPVRLVDGLGSDVAFGGADFSVSRTGTLIYRTAKGMAGELPVVWIDSSGKTEPLIPRPDLYFEPRMSPDGHSLAVVKMNGNGPDLYVWDIERQILSPVTSDQRNNFYPVWTPDSRHVVFESRWDNIHTLWFARADGGSEPHKLLESSQSIVPYSISPDGRRIAYHQVSPGAGTDLWTLPLDLGDPDRPKPGTPEAFLRTPAGESEPEFSPDGRWMAYHSDESRPGQIYVRPFPPGPGKWQISRDGGSFPRFTHDGKQLFYLGSDGHLMVVECQAKGDAFAAGNPRVWMETTLNATGSFEPYDVAPDGKRIVSVPRFADNEDKGSVHVELLLNVLDDLRRRIP